MFFAAGGLVNWILPTMLRIKEYSVCQKELWSAGAGMGNVLCMVLYRRFIELCGGGYVGGLTYGTSFCVILGWFFASAGFW